MAKNKTRSLAGKKFFRLVVLSVASLGLLFTANVAVQQRTTTQSEATGSSVGLLGDCSISNRYSGGIQLYNMPNKQGGYRIMCLPIKSDNPNYKPNYFDYNLGSDDSNRYLLYSNIWNFNNKTDSVRLRVNKGCQINAALWNGSVFNNHLFTIANYNWSGTKDIYKWLNLPESKINKATSISFQINCKDMRFVNSLENTKDTL